MKGNSITLHGCRPTPLASYLKALGVLRLISSRTNNASGQATDPQARGWWEDECFHIRTTLSQDALGGFFLRDYAPSPIIAPWNQDSGFFSEKNEPGLQPLVEQRVAARFTGLSSVMRRSRDLLRELKLSKRPEGTAKADFIATLRAEFPQAALMWLDATVPLTVDEVAFPPLLGAGGSDGRLDFTKNFARRLVSRQRPLGLFDSGTGEPTSHAAELLDAALFHTIVHGLNPAAAGQFAPGAAGGANSSTGYSGNSEVNPWDFVLTLEGATSFAGTAGRRHQSAGTSGTGFPFTVRTVGAGWGGLEAADEGAARAEFWAPIWTRPASPGEVEALFAEGRAVLKGRAATDGIEFARAASSLGVSRGFREFQRFGFLTRAGNQHLATPLGRYSTAPSRGGRLLEDLDAGGWLDRVRRAGRRKEEPAAVRQAVKRLEDALFGLTSTAGGTVDAQAALVALGRLVAWLAVSRHGREATGAPPPRLSPKWIRQADDGSPEFRIAAALASLGLPSTTAAVDLAQADEADNVSPTDPADASSLEGRGHGAPPMAAHFAPLHEGRFFYRGGLSVRRAWAKDDSPVAVWGVGGLVSNMIAVLERRLVEATTRGLNDKPLTGGSPARLADVAAFLSGDFDDARCAVLLAGLVWARPTPLRTPKRESNEESVPFAYAALKTILTPDATLQAVHALPENTRLPVPPGLIAQLRTSGSIRDGHATDAAVRWAQARARASGLPTLFGPTRTGDPGARMGAGIAADRLAASLLIPIHDLAVTTLIRRAYPGALPEPENRTTEDTTHAA